MWEEPKTAEGNLLDDLADWVENNHDGVARTDLLQPFFDAHPEHTTTLKKYETKAQKGWGKMSAKVTGATALSKVADVLMARDAALKKVVAAADHIEYGIDPEVERMQEELEEKKRRVMLAKQARQRFVAAGTAARCVHAKRLLRLHSRPTLPCLLVAIHMTF